MRADAVVGTGTAGSCTEVALAAALGCGAPSGSPPVSTCTGGGSVTFNCGASPVTITVTSTKTISADTTIDGGSLITISGGNSVGIFFVANYANFTVQNLTIANGNYGGYGGGIYNYNGTLALRARIVLRCASGAANTAVARHLHVSQQMVCKWRARFAEYRLEGLLDEPRPGPLKR